MIEGGGRGGFSRSQKQSVTLTVGQNTHAAVIDLGKNYAFLVIALANAAGIAAATSLSIEVGVESSAALYSLYVSNDPTQKWQKVLPTAGSLYMRVEGADLARFLKLTLSNNVTGSVTFDIWGFDGAA